MFSFKKYFLLLVIVFISTFVNAQSTVKQWMKFEHSFISEQQYENPIYEIKKLVVTFIFLNLFKKKSGGTSGQRVNY